MGSIHKALIEAIVYIATADGSDDREDDDVRALEAVFGELNQADSNELDGLLATIREAIQATQNSARIDALEAIIDSLSE